MMMKMSKIAVVLVLSVCGSAVVAQKAPQATEATVAAILASSSSAPISIFVTAIKNAELYAKLTSASFTGTILLPNDAAFDNLVKRLNASLPELLAEKELLKTVLQYHVSPTVVPRAENFATVSALPTLLPGRTLRGVMLPFGPGLKGEINLAGIVPSGISGLAGSGSAITAAVYMIDTVLIPNITISTAAPPPARAKQASPPALKPSPSRSNSTSKSSNSSLVAASRPANSDAAARNSSTPTMTNASSAAASTASLLSYAVAVVFLLLASS